MMNIPMNSAKMLVISDAQRVNSRRGFELFAARAGRLNLKSRPQRRAQFRDSLVQRDAVLQRHIDAVELASAAKNLLRRVNIHHRQIAAKRARQAAGLHDAANREHVFAIHGQQRNAAAEHEPVLFGEST